MFKNSLKLVISASIVASGALAFGQALETAEKSKVTHPTTESRDAAEGAKGVDVGADDAKAEKADSSAKADRARVQKVGAASVRQTSVNVGGTALAVNTARTLEAVIESHKLVEAAKITPAIDNLVLKSGGIDAASAITKYLVGRKDMSSSDPAVQKRAHDFVVALVKAATSNPARVRSMVANLEADDATYAGNELAERNMQTIKLYVLQEMTLNSTEDGVTALEHGEINALEGEFGKTPIEANRIKEDLNSNHCLRPGA